MTQIDIANFKDDGSWLPMEHRKNYREAGGAQYIMEQIASGKSLIDIQNESGIPADKVLLFSNAHQGFALALQQAMDIRAMNTGEQIQGLANQYDSMVEAQETAVNNNDMERLVLLQSLHESQRKLLREKSEVLKYIDIKNRADRAANKVVNSFDDVINEISDAEVKELK